jgi:hypothetical protein
VKKYLKRIPLYLAAIGAGLYVVFFFAQASLILVPNNQMIATPSVHDWGYDEILLNVDSESTVLWFIPLEGARGTVLYSHGNDFNISTCLGVVKHFRSLGFSVALYDYGGYGKSTGAPSEVRLYADAMAAWEYLTEERELDPASILLWGPSFGGGPTCELRWYIPIAPQRWDSTPIGMPADSANHDWSMGCNARCHCAYSRQALWVPCIIGESSQRIDCYRNPHLYPCSTDIKQDMRFDQSDCIYKSNTLLASINLYSIASRRDGVVQSMNYP